MTASETPDAENNIVYRVSRKRHICSPPGWWQRRKLDLDYGSVWQCPLCGDRWRWSSSWGSDSWDRIGAGQ